MDVAHCTATADRGEQQIRFDRKLKGWLADIERDAKLAFDQNWTGGLSAHADMRGGGIIFHKSELTRRTTSQKE